MVSYRNQSFAVHSDLSQGSLPLNACLQVDGNLAQDNAAQTVHAAQEVAQQQQSKGNYVEVVHLEEQSNGVDICEAPSNVLNGLRSRKRADFSVFDTRKDPDSCRSTAAP